MIGKTISHYKIISKLGEGGMGVVYKAEDTRLDRSVALKFLPTALGTQQAAKKRFIQEAKAASSLEHPNICAIHDIGETDDSQMFIAMPHYDGETLQEKIARGPLDIGEASDIVRQLASGLAKAHEQGIVHRDIKPGNIFITKDGHVKILDFGLAKLATETRLTKSGTTLGTIAYMSPEQASGGDVDARSDIFSLGVVFYELLTGSLPFKGDHEAAIIYGILHNDPEPLQTSRGDIPEGVQQVIDMALAKNVDERYQSVQELKNALVGLGVTGRAEASTQARPGAGVRASRFRRIAPWVAGGMLFATVFFVMRNGKGPSTDRSLPVSPTYTQLTFTGDTREPIISPDGDFVAYFREAGNRKEILVRDIGGGEPVVVFEGFDACYSLRWSPDGAKLLAALFTADVERHIYISPRLGGAVRRLDYYPYASWSPDGLRVAVTWRPWRKVLFIDVATGRVEADTLALEFPYAWLNDIDWSPDGNRLLVHVSPEDGGEEVWTVNIDGGEAEREVAERKIVSPRWSPFGGAIYYVVPKGATQSLWRIRIDSKSDRIQKKPTEILSGMAGLGTLSFTSDGTSMTYARHVVDRDLWAFSTLENDEDADPKRLTSGTAVDGEPSVSPDGREIAFVRSMGEASNIFRVSAEGGPARQITFTDSDCHSPVWSPDGKEIAFVAFENGAYRVWTVSADGGAAEVLGSSRAAEYSWLVWAPGKSIITPTLDGRDYLFLDPGSGGGRRLLHNEAVGYVGPLVVAPDETRAAIYWNRPDDGIWEVNFGDSPERLIVRGHKDPFGWSPGGEWIYYYSVPEIGRVRVDGTSDEFLRKFPFDNVEEHPSVTMTPDAGQIVGSFEIKAPSDIWLVENFDPDVQ